MKELSIEEKAKAYDEAIERAKGVIEQNPLMEYLKKGIEYILPELKESKDEQIRKHLIKHFGNKSKEDWNGVPVKSILAWLEKQGEQKAYTLEQAANIFLDALSNTPYNNKPITDAQVITKELLKFLSDARSYNPNAINEQKPAEWSEEDERIRKRIIDALHGDVLEMSEIKEAVAWLEKQGEPYPILSNSLNIGKVEQKPAWSEDADIIEWLIGYLEYQIKNATIHEEKNNCLDAISMLKSIRPQSHWKPSGEQFNVLNEVINFAANHESPHWNDYIFGTLNNLIRQLKKLREK